MMDGVDDGWSDWTEDKAAGLLGVRPRAPWRGPSPRRWLCPSRVGGGYSIPSMSLCIATYIDTYSGDAPMDARWINLSCMETKQRHHTKPLQINGPKEAV